HVCASLMLVFTALWHVFHTHHSCWLVYLILPLFSLTILRPPTSTLFPYTTLFRSVHRGAEADRPGRERHCAGPGSGARWDAALHVHPRAAGLLGAALGRGCRSAGAAPAGCLCGAQPDDARHHRPVESAELGLRSGRRASLPV